jgi:GDP-D-mannose dehydratase
MKQRFDLSALSLLTQSFEAPSETLEIITLLTIEDIEILDASAQIMRDIEEELFAPSFGM